MRSTSTGASPDGRHGGRRWRLALGIALLAACQPAVERQLWRSARDADTLPAYQAFVARFPHSRHTKTARLRLAALRSALDSLRSVRLVVQQHYVYGLADQPIESLELPVASYVTELLHGADINIDSSAQAVVHIELQGRALAQQYSPVDERQRASRERATRQYAGARLRGTLTWETPAGTAYRRDLTCTSPAPERLPEADHPTPRHAPFDEALRSCMPTAAARMIGTLFGGTPLVQALSAPQMEIRVGAATALGDVGDSTVVPPLLRALRQTAAFDFRAALIESLGRLGDVRAVEDLNDELHRPFDIDARRAAAEALGRIGDQRAVPYLLDALERDTEAVRSAAVLALRRLTGVDHGRDADAWRRWWASQISP